MKKFLSILLAVCMLVSLSSFSALAATVGGEGSATLPENATSQNITILLSGSVASRFAVDITFGSLTFAYGGVSVWDPSSHDYVVSETTGWNPVSVGADLITIENHSDRAVAYTVETTKTNTSYDIDGAPLVITANKGATATRIAACSRLAVTAPSDTVTIGITGKPQGLTTTTGDVLGNVKVVITAVE